MQRGVALHVTLGIGTTAVGAAAAPNDPAPAAPAISYSVTPTPPDGTTSTLSIQPSAESRLLTRFPMIVVQADPSIDPIPTSHRSPAYFPMRVIVPEGIDLPARQVPGSVAVPARPLIAPKPGALQFTPRRTRSK